MTEQCESYRAAWDRAAEWQRKGYVTRVWFDGETWTVRYMTRGEWRAKQND